MDERLKLSFFALLRAGLWGGETLHLPGQLTDKDWDAIYTQAINHTVEGILFESLPLLTDKQLPPRELRIRWTVRVDQIERFNRRMNGVIGEQLEYFSQKGVNALLLKGQGVASCYINPLRRVSGDIDWFFEDDGYKTILDDLRKKKEIAFPLDSFSCDWKGVNVDFHKRMFDVFNPFKIPYLNRIAKREHQHQQLVSIGAKNVTILSPELQLLQVNTHILKHLLFLGIGLRQLCDAARVYYKYRNAIDSDFLQEIYMKTGVMKWMHVLHRILVEYIGLPVGNLPFTYPSNTLSADTILTKIWHSGNFGFYDTSVEETNTNLATVKSHLNRCQRKYKGFRLYYKYAPEEALFFTARRFKGGISSKIFGHKT